MIEFNIEVSLPPSDDFYLQWQDIYWWQMKFNLTVMLRNELERLGCEKK
jgi:hypothetical protein